MARLHPGVYIEEVSSGVRPIEGVSTSTAAFIGKAEMGALNKAVLVTSFQEFQTKYGAFLSDPAGALGHSVLQFFNNGGKASYVVRIAELGAAAAEITIKDRKAAPANTLTIKASSEGEWGNKLDIEVSDGSANGDNEFAISVLKDRSDLVPPLPTLLLETLDNLSMNPAADNYVEKVVAAKSKYVTAAVVAGNLASAPAGESRSGQLPVGNGAAALKLGAANGGAETPGAAGPPATSGVSRSGANPAGTNPGANPLPADQRKFLINLNGDGAKEATIPARANTGAEIAAAIQTAVRALAPSNPANQAAYSGFTCNFDVAGGAGNEAYVLTSGVAGAGSSVVVTNSTAPSISLPAGQTKFIIEIDGDGPHLVTLSAPPALNSGANIATAIANAVTAITPKRSANAAAFSGFTCVYQNDSARPDNPSLLLTSGTAAGANRVRSSVRVTSAPVAAENAAGLLKLGSTNGGREVVGAAALRPANSQTPTEYHLGDATVTGNVGDAKPGLDGSTPQTQRGEDFKNGLPALDTVRDFSILCIPGISSVDVIDTAVNYCTQRADCFFIGDCRKDDDTVAEGKDFLDGLNKKTSYGAIYFPWLKMTDPTGRSAEPILTPPSGFVAGMYARIDARRGVWKAPAGTEANLGGAIGLAANITDTEQDFLNPIGVNVIRSFPASGIVIWGARTLATRSDPEYRYVPVRRTAIFLEQSLYNGIQWAVFEPNDEVLWASLRLNITAFLLLQFRAGAFQGKTPSEAFFVKCDSSTTTQADIDAGIVNILVGFAPLKPAEFVVLRLSQKAGQTGA